MDAFPHHIRPVLRGGDYDLARYFCEGLAVVVRGEVFCFQRESDAERFRRRFGCVRVVRRWIDDDRRALCHAEEGSSVKSAPDDGVPVSAWRPRSPL